MKEPLMKMKLQKRRNAMSTAEATTQCPPLPPFTRETAIEKVRRAEDEWHDDSGNWFRSYGNENWEFDESGLMRLRFASTNDLAIKEKERR
jgi:nuclear transport factor 2 (NTF2) superfamily protein